MPASYPVSIKSFITKLTGDTIQAAHVNELQEETNALEAGLLNGIAHVLRPDLSINNRDIGISTARFRDLFLGRTIDIAQGTITTDLKAIDITATWNAGGVTFTGIKGNWTDTASAAASLLLDLQVGAASKFKVSKAGLTTIASGLDITAGAIARIGTTDAFDLVLKRNNVDEMTVVAGGIKTAQYNLPAGSVIGQYDTVGMQLRSGTPIAVGSGVLVAMERHASGGALRVSTSNAAGTADVAHFIIPGATNAPVGADDGPSVDLVDIAELEITNTDNPGAGVFRSSPQLTLRGVHGAAGGAHQWQTRAKMLSVTDSELAIRRIIDGGAAVDLLKLSSGGVLTILPAGGALVLPADPTTALQAATKQYADAVGGGKPFIVATMANIPATDGALLVRVDATSETWYEAEFEDASTREVTFELPAKAFTSLRLTWRSPAITGDVKWFAEVREKGDADVLGSGTIVASGNVVDTTKGTANQLNEATISASYTPAGSKRIAVLRIQRQPADAADTLGNVARLLYVEAL